MQEFTVRRLDREEYDPRRITAPSAEEAARWLIESDEQDGAEYPIASGLESAIVEVDGLQRFEVCGDPGPHYVTCRR